ncbi:hypothetical protein B0A48_17972 [Cryoendolithus antarcticus]|uniref:HORMA domain-containing protein n=1 Tax=Cryoendolithus antarcticus TaxID=1507870 RepID=A0A1V8S9H8_9PEZI|nr:hypothetical protein B0A48_17972 [Cryoendolithus antarcticus]
MPSAAPSSADKSKVHKLSIKGSSKLCVEFFEFATNTILFQRGVYPPEDFAPVKKYGLNMMVSLDDQVKAYIKKIMGQLSKWMQKSKISKLVIVNVFNDSSKKRAEASIEDKENAGARTESDAAPEKTEPEIQAEIQSLFRQVTASVTFLPMLDGNCTFNVLVYADADSDVPLEWGDSDAKEVKNAEKVQLRSFSTNSHKIDTMVSYRLAE